MPLLLHDLHAAAGAAFTDYGRREMVSHYGDAASEALALYAQAGLIDWGGGVRLRVSQTGSRTALDFLQGMLSNDLENLGPDGGCYATLLTNTGKVISDCRVWPRQDHILLVTEAHTGAALSDTLAKYGFLDDIEVTDISDELGMLGLYGYRAVQTFDAGIGALLPGLPPYVLRPLDTPQGTMLVTRDDRTGSTGFNLFATPSVLRSIWAALAGAGARPCGLDAFHTLRVEAGFPWVGIDVDDTVLPNAAGLESAVSYTKGCYVGQEAVAKLHYLGKPNRVLIGLRLGDATPPERDTPLQCDGNAVGRITSAIRSPHEHETLALGFCKTSYAKPGTTLQVGADVEGVIAALPFRRAPADFQAIPEPDIREGGRENPRPSAG